MSNIEEKAITLARIYKDATRTGKEDLSDDLDDMINELINEIQKLRAENKQLRRPDRNILGGSK